MKVIIRYPQRREVELPGRRRVREVLRALNLNPESVIVLRGDTLLTGDVLLQEEDEVEVLPAISGG